MFNPNINLIQFKNEEYILYAKHLIINQVGLNGQKRLKNAKILVIGAGGIGCPAMLYLVSCGIGYIGIIDNDFVSTSNLNRQILYSINDINKNKVECAKLKLQSINPHCKIIIHLYKINNINASEIIPYYDIILDATDNFNTRYIIDYYCYKLHKIHLYSAVSKFESQLAVFNYKSNIRYSYIYSKELNFLYNNCSNEGILGFITGHIGILQATQATKLILGININIYNDLSIYNLLNTSIQKKKIYFQYNKNNIINKIQNNNIINNSIKKQQIINYYKNKKQRKNFIILDIREKNEFLLYSMRYAINIPITKFKLKKTIRFLQNYQNKQFYIYCNTQYRSQIIFNICQCNKINSYIIQK